MRLRSIEKSADYPTDRRFAAPDPMPAARPRLGKHTPDQAIQAIGTKPGCCLTRAIQAWTFGYGSSEKGPSSQTCV